MYDRFKFYVLSIPDCGAYIAFPCLYAYPSRVAFSSLFLSCAPPRSSPCGFFAISRFYVPPASASDAYTKAVYCLVI